MILPHILLVFPLITLEYRIIGGLEISPKTNNRGRGEGKNVHVFFKIFSITRSTHMQNDNKKRSWLLNLKTIYYNAMVSVACM